MSLATDVLGFFRRRGKMLDNVPAAPPVAPPLEQIQPQPQTRDIDLGKTEKRDFDLKSQEALRLFVFGNSSKSGVSVNDTSLLSIPPMYGAIGYIKDGMAMLDRKVMRKLKAGGNEDATDHPLHHLVNNAPHPYYTWFDLISAWVANACLGNGYIWIHWNELTMRPETLELIPSGLCWPSLVDGQLWYDISGDINGRIVAARVPYTDILHLRGFSLNAMTGRPLSIQHRTSLAAAIASMEYTESILGNGARPSLALKMNQPLDDTERANLRANIMAELSGTDKAGIPLILDEGMDVQYLQWSPQEVAYLDYAKLTADQATMITKVPADLLFSTGTGTYGSALQRNQNFLTHCLGPWREKIEETVNTRLFWESEKRSKKVFFMFDSSVFLRMDAQTEANVATVLVGNSIITPNEARARLGLNPVEGGDVLYGNINMIPVGDIVNVAMAKYLSSKGEALQGQQSEKPKTSESLDGVGAKTDPENQKNPNFVQDGSL